MSELSGYDMIVAASKYEAEPSAKAVLCWLAYFADRKTRTCFPCQSLLSRLTGKCERTIRDALKFLESDGAITRRKQRVGNRRGSDLITLSNRMFEPATAAASKTGFEPAKSASLNRQPLPGNYKEQEPLSAGAETAPRKNKMLRL